MLARELFRAATWRFMSFAQKIAHSVVDMPVNGLIRRCKRATKRILGKGMNSTRGKFGRTVSCLLYIGPYNLSLMGNPMADYKLVV